MMRCLKKARVYLYVRGQKTVDRFCHSCADERLKAGSHVCTVEPGITASVPN